MGKAKREETLTHTRQSDGAPKPYGDLMSAAGSTIIHYQRIYHAELDHRSNSFYAVNGEHFRPSVR